MADEEGVLGNLPRSRPGRRSEKRASRAEGNASKAAASSRGERSGSKAAAPPAGARARSAARPKPAAGGPDQVSGAIRGVAGLAVTGAKVATGVTREVLRRLPRP